MKMVSADFATKLLLYDSNFIYSNIVHLGNNIMVRSKTIFYLALFHKPYQKNLAWNIPQANENAQVFSTSVQNRKQSLKPEEQEMHFVVRKIKAIAPCSYSQQRDIPAFLFREDSENLASSIPVGHNPVLSTCSQHFLLFEGQRVHSFTIHLTQWSLPYTPFSSCLKTTINGLKRSARGPQGRRVRGAGQPCPCLPAWF